MALVLTAASAGSAAAVTVDFHGKALTAFFSTSNARQLGRAAEGVETDSANMGVGKFRLRTEVGTEDGLAKMVYGFETGANNFGDQWGYSGDSVDFENRFAYIQSVIPGVSHNIYGRAGLQKTGVNHWLWTETAPGLTLHGKGEVNWMTGWFRGIEQDDLWEDEDLNYPEDPIDDADLFVVKADFRPASDLRLGGFGVYARNFGSKKLVYRDADQFWLGLTGALEGPVFASWDLIYQGGDAGDTADQDVSAYLANLTVGAGIEDGSRVSANALYVSGDDDRQDGDLEAFQSIDADVKVGQIFFKDSLAGSCDRFVDDMFGSTMPTGLKDNGLINLALEGEFQLGEKNNLRAAGRYLLTAEDDPYFNEDDLGCELDLWYTYKMNKNLSFKLEGAYLFPGDLAEEIFRDDDDVFLLSAGLKFVF
ncbi:MAG: hypothetical protein R6X08_01970 [Desulfosalsimonadaceae bacterium]